MYNLSAHDFDGTESKAELKAKFGLNYDDNKLLEELKTNTALIEALATTNNSNLISAVFGFDTLSKQPEWGMEEI